MIFYFFTPQTFAGALRRIALSFIMLAVGCAINKWQLSQAPAVTEGFYLGSGTTGQLIEMAHRFATWPYIIGFATIGIFTQIASVASDWIMGRVRFGKDDSPQGPTIH